VLVFFYDILIYNKSWEEHLQKIGMVLKFLKSNNYIQSLVSHDGVKVDINEIKAMMEWPIPNKLKKLGGFLGLIGNYNKLVNNYGWITTPLTQLLKKELFSWTK